MNTEAYIGALSLLATSLQSVRASFPRKCSGHALRADIHGYRQHRSRRFSRRHAITRSRKHTVGRRSLLEARICLVSCQSAFSRIYRDSTATVERSQRLAFPIMATKVTRRTVPKHPLWELCKGVLYFALGPIALIWALSNFFPSLHSLVQYLITP